MYVVKKELCVGCGVCLSLCRMGAVKMKQDIAVIDYQRCGECGKCYDACRQKAICEPNGTRRIPQVMQPMYGRPESAFPIDGSEKKDQPQGGPVRVSDAERQERIRAADSITAGGPVTRKLSGVLSRRNRPR